MELRTLTDNKNDKKLEKESLPEYLFSRYKTSFNTTLFEPAIKLNNSLLLKSFKPKGFRSNNESINIINKGKSSKRYLMTERNNKQSTEDLIRTSNTLNTLNTSNALNTLNTLNTNRDEQNTRKFYISPERSTSAIFEKPYYENTRNDSKKYSTKLRPKSGINTFNTVASLKTCEQESYQKISKINSDLFEAEKTLKVDYNNII